MVTGSVITLHICHSCHSSAKVSTSQERRLGLLVQDGGTKRKRSQGSNPRSGEYWLRQASQPCLSSEHKCSIRTGCQALGSPSVKMAAEFGGRLEAVG